MSDGPSIGADAPTASSTAPADTGPQAPNPIATEGSPAPKPEPKPEARPEPTARDALARARERVEARDRETAKAEPKGGRSEPGKEGGKAAEAKPEPRERGDHGHFAPKGAPAQAAGTDRDNREPARAPQDPAPSWTGEDDPPARFTAGAKAKWAATDPEMRAEVTRAVKELTGGFEKYKADAEAHAELREFHDLAQRSGTTVKAALANYVGLERLLAANPVAGFERIAQNMGLSFRQVAEHVLGRPPDQIGAAHDAQLREAQSVAQRERATSQQLAARVRELEAQAQTSVASEIEAFAAGKPRFAELRPLMGRLINGGLAASLTDAYAMAERMSPPAQGAPPTPAPSPALAASPPAAQTGRGEKSIAGAPTPGSDPERRRVPSSSIRESLRRAAAAAG